MPSVYSIKQPTNIYYISISGDGSVFSTQWYINERKLVCMCFRLEVNKTLWFTYIIHMLMRYSWTSPFVHLSEGCMLICNIQYYLSI